MSIWPSVEHGGFASQEIITRPNIRVSTSCYLPSVRTPMHVHPYHDQFISVADGELRIIMPEATKTISAGDSIIISAGINHTLQSGTVETRFLSVFLGDGASQPGKTTLPESVRKLFDPKAVKQEEIIETLLSPDEVSRAANLSEPEKETLSWVINRLIKRLETGKYKVTEKTKPKTRKIQNIAAWQKDDSLFLWAESKRMLLSLSLKRGSNQNDYIKLNDIDIYWPSLRHLPEVEVIK